MENFLDFYLKSRKSPKEYLLSVVDEYTIYSELIGQELEVGGSKLIESPLRADSLPTFGLFVHNEKDIIMFKDFAYESGDVFKFVRLFAGYNDKINLRTQMDVVNYINKKLGLGLYGQHVSDKIYRNTTKINIKTSRNIRFKSRKFTRFDLQYWKSYYITEEVLKYFNVRSVELLFDENDNIIKSFGRSELCFAYVIKNKVKLYQPLEFNGYKWRNTCPSHYIQGWKQRRKKKKLIITKSLKDIMVFFIILGNDYDIIAPHSENYNFTQDIVDKINAEYDVVIVIYDFDRAGVNGSNKLKKLYNWKPKFIDTKRVMINGKLKVIDKDISDLAKNKGIIKAAKRCKKIGL